MGNDVDPNGPTVRSPPDRGAYIMELTDVRRLIEEAEENCAAGHGAHTDILPRIDVIIDAMGRDTPAIKLGALDTPAIEYAVARLTEAAQELEAQRLRLQELLASPPDRGALWDPIHGLKRMGGVAQEGIGKARTILGTVLERHRTR